MHNAALGGHVFVIDALAAKFGGNAYAAVEIATALSRRDDVRRVVVITRPDSIVHRGCRDLPDGTVVTVRSTLGPELAQRLAWETVRLPRLLRRHGAAGAFTHSGMLPRSLPVRFVCLQANPKPYEEPEGRAQALRRWAFARTARAACATYVPSLHVRDLVGPLPRVRVVPFGVMG